MKKKLILSLTGALLAFAASPAMAQMPRGAAILEGADSDRNGQISRSEFAAAREKELDRLDRNDDGAVSRDDFSRLIRFRRQIGERLEDWIAASDTNRDGRVTKEELRASPMRLFERADANNNGVVEQAELAALRTKP